MNAVGPPGPRGRGLAGRRAPAARGARGDGRGLDLGAHRPRSSRAAAEALRGAPVAAVEVNVSCPNLHDGTAMFAHSPAATAAAVDGGGAQRRAVLGEAQPDDRARRRRRARRGRRGCDRARAREHAARARRRRRATYERARRGVGRAVGTAAASGRGALGRGVPRRAADDADRRRRRRAVRATRSSRSCSPAPTRSRSAPRRSPTRARHGRCSVRRDGGARDTASRGSRT